jgi:hypothetical protein
MLIARVGQHLPARWIGEPGLADVGSFGELVSRLRRLDHRSDEALRALARLADAGEPEACLVVTAALLPLLIVRCGRRPELLAEAVPELAARMVEPAREPPASGVANRLLRRVVWRVRHDPGDGGRQVYVSDLAHVAPPAGDGCFEASTVDRLALQEFRRRLAKLPKGREAWDVLVGTAAQVSLSSTQRSRLAMHRRALRPLAEASLAG